MHPTRMGAVEQPPTIGLSHRSRELDRLGHPRVGFRFCATEVVQRAQHVVTAVADDRRPEPDRPRPMRSGLGLSRSTGGSQVEFAHGDAVEECRLGEAVV